jgi:hypothetical protein
MRASCPLLRRQVKITSGSPKKCSNAIAVTVQNGQLVYRHAQHLAARLRHIVCGSHSAETTHETLHSKELGDVPPPQPERRQHV